MAGRANKHETNAMPPAEMKKIMEAQEAELVELRAVVARLEHDAITNTLPALVTDYSPTLNNKAIALGAIGLSPDEIKVEMGITPEDWKAWKGRYPAFASAVSRARSLATAYWFRKARVAMETNNWRFNFDRLPKIINLMFIEEEQDIGDASALIVLDPAA